MEKVRVGIIGVGNIGSAHAKAVYGGDVPEATLAALCDTSPEKREKLKALYPDVPLFDDDEAMLSSGLFDLVILSVPHYCHAPLAVRAFEKGLNVLTEKPCSVTLVQAKKMVAAAEKSGKVFGIMFNQRQNALFAKARDLVQTGKLGDLRRVNWIITNWFRTEGYYRSGDWRATWSGEGGGVLMNQAVHNLDLFQWICGMPCEITADCRCGTFHDIEVEDEATLYCRYPNGATGVFITSTGDYPGVNRLEITGTKGTVLIEKNTLTLTEYGLDTREFVRMGESDKNPVTVTVTEGERFNGHVLTLRNLCRHLLSKEALVAPGEDGLNEVSLCNAAYLSSWEHRPVALPLSDTDANAVEVHLKEKIEKGRKPVGNTEKSGDTAAYLDRWNVNW